MKATQKDFATVAPRAAREARVFFLCGTDESGAQDAAFALAGMIEDAGERIEFSGAELKKDPVRLGDEARSTSLFGDSRHIWVRASGDDAHDAVATLLAGPMEGPARPCPVLIVASGATDKSRTAKLLADRKDALVAMFYPPDLAAVTRAVRDMAGAMGIKGMDGALGERVARSVGLDTRLARSEIEKFAIFLDSAADRTKTITADVLDALGARTEDDGLMPLVNAVMAGETGKIAGELKRIRELGLSPVGVLLAFERRAAQLAQLAARMGPRGNPRDVVAEERAARRIFWKDERDLTTQLTKWRGRKLARLVDKLAQMHRAMLANSQGAELMLAQGLAEIGRAAAGDRG